MDDTGDRPSFEERFAALAAISYKVGFRLVGDRAEAEDMAQEAPAERRPPPRAGTATSTVGDTSPRPSDVGRRGFYEPGRRWPHMTCAYALTTEQVGEAVVIATRHLPPAGHLTAGGVEDGTTGENWPIPSGWR